MSMRIEMESAHDVDPATGRPLYELNMSAASGNTCPPITATAESFKEMGQAIFNLATQAEASER